MPLQIVVPMAGAGQRFVDAGYRLPKPLIPVSGVPMVVRAVQDLPAADRLVFVVRSEHVRDHRLDRELRRHFPDCRVVTVDRLTEGQACTVRLAAPELEPDWPVIVASCDCTHLYDRQRLAELTANSDTACLVWTYRGEPRTQLAPRQYGWVRVDGDRAVEVCCKQPISDRVVGDHAVSGFFSFQSARLMVEGIDDLVRSNRRVNNEFYMDVVPNVLIGRGQVARVFEVIKYIGWGTPADLEDYRRWEGYFDQHRARRAS
jgi:NDP-sugar pyrophosphorylase family protein